MGVITIDSARLNQVLIDVVWERVQQVERWGDQHHDDGFWLAVETEELGEVARAMLKQKPTENGNLREELIQVAAVAIAWVEDIDSR